MTNTVRRVLRKKNILARLGKRFARNPQVKRMAYRRNKQVRPKDAFRLVRSRCLSELMTTLYVGSLVEKPVIPIIVGNWPTAMLRAEPVMNAEMAGSEMRSTTQPMRMRPRKRTMLPAMTAKEDAIMSLEISWPLSFSSAASTTLPVTVDRTATGPMVMSLDVAKNQ